MAFILQSYIKKEISQASYLIITAELVLNAKHRRAQFCSSLLQFQYGYSFSS